jgi:hypothetical protein
MFVSWHKEFSQLRWSRLDREARVLSDGYAGGLAGLTAVAIDLIVRYAL